MHDGVRLHHRSLTPLFLGGTGQAREKTSRRCQARWAGLGRRVAEGLKERGWPWRSESLKWEPPGRMDTEMSEWARNGVRPYPPAA